MLTEKIKKYIEEHLNDDVKQLALKREQSLLTPEEAIFAISQIEARQRLKEKLPTLTSSPDAVFPMRIAWEQCSSEATARFKAQLIQKLTGKDTFEKTADITGGLGIDSTEIARISKDHTYIEINPELAKTAEINFRVLGFSNVNINNCNSEEWMSANGYYDLICADPARRGDKGEKVFRIEDCQPNIRLHRDRLLEKADLLMVKLSPILDMTLAAKELNAEYVIAIGAQGECKEIVAIAGLKRKTKFAAVEVERPEELLEFDPEKERQLRTPLADASDIVSGNWIYEPSATFMKAGAWASMAAKYGLKKIAEDSHLFISDRETVYFPGRRYIINKAEKYSKKAMLSAADDKKRANITTRNFPQSVADIRKSLKIKEGGEVTIFLTTDKNGEKLLIQALAGMRKKL